MAHNDKDEIDFEKLETDAMKAIDADNRYWVENDAKFRAVHQKVQSYDEFRDIVLASHLKPLDKSDNFSNKTSVSWNKSATKNVASSNSVPHVDSKDICGIPNSSSEFIHTWSKLKGDQKWDFLARCKTHLQMIFSLEISVDVFSDILSLMSCLDVHTQQNYVDVTLAFLDSISHCQRFTIFSVLIESTDRERITKVLDKVVELKSDEETVELVTKLKTAFNCENF